MGDCYCFTWTDIWIVLLDWEFDKDTEIEMKNKSKHCLCNTCSVCSEEIYNQGWNHALGCSYLRGRKFYIKIQATKDGKKCFIYLRVRESFFRDMIK